MKKITIVLFLITISLSIKAQDYIKHRINEDFSIGQQIVGDFDNDGDNDLFGIRYFFESPNDLIYLKNNFQDSVFQMEGTVIYSDIEAFGTATKGDFDLDGDLDVIIAVGFDNPVLNIFTNDGFGNFTMSSLDIPNVVSIKSVDFDGDGDIDLFGRKDTTMTIISNNGNGKFSILKSFDLKGKITTFEVSDIDDDGDFDIILGDNEYKNSKIILYENNGSFNFSRKVLYQGGDEMNQIIIKDINQDGKTDISFIEDDVCRSLINKGNLSFTQKLILKKEGYSSYLPAFDLADIDNDGDIDVVISNYSKGVFFYENKAGNSLNEFEANKITNIQPVFDVIIEEFTGDSKLDILLYNGDLWILENDLKLRTYNIANIETIIYPNPTKDIVSISNQNSIINRISISNLSGKLLFSKIINEYSYSLDFGDFVNGIYFLEVQTGKDILVKKLIKE